jgi:hypothetical protein
MADVTPRITTGYGIYLCHDPDIDDMDIRGARMLPSIILANVLQEEREREIRRRFRHVSGVPTGPRHPETTTERKTVAGQLRPAVTSGAVCP